MVYIPIDEEFRDAIEEQKRTPVSRLKKTLDLAEFNALLDPDGSTARIAEENRLYQEKTRKISVGEYCSANN